MLCRRCREHPSEGLCDGCKADLNDPINGQVPSRTLPGNQVMHVDQAVTGGTFVIKFMGVRSNPIPYDASLSVIQKEGDRVIRRANGPFRKLRRWLDRISHRRQNQGDAGIAGERDTEDSEDHSRGEMQAGESLHDPAHGQDY